MSVIDERGRVLGRINLIDAVAAVLLFVLIPVAYGAYLLFRTPPPKLISIAPARLYGGPNQRIQIQGVNLRPFMRVSFGSTQGVTFSINSTTSAQVEVPELSPGDYDVVLYDFKQEVDRLPKALTILSLSPNPTIDMDVSGSFKNLDESMAKQFHAGQKLINGTNTAEVLRVGTPVPAVFRVTAGTSVMSMPVAGQLELPAAVRVHCYADVAADGSVRCLVPGPVHAAPVAPDSLLTLPGPQGWVGFQIATVALPAAPAVVVVRASFVARSEIAQIVKAGDVDADAVAYATPATIVAATTRAIGPDSVIDATLRMPAVRGPSGWVYNNQPLKAGMPIRFETARYLIQGQIVRVQTPGEAER
jgi:hypothetical protein